jgi:hypothetical protein
MKIKDLIRMLSMFDFEKEIWIHNLRDEEIFIPHGVSPDMHDDKTIYLNVGIKKDVK